MDQDAIRRIQRELEDQARELFPAGVVRGVAILQYGEAGGIEPGESLVRVFLEAPEPEELDQAMDAFMYAHQAAIREFRIRAARQLPEATQMEFAFGETGGPDAARTTMHFGRAEERASFELTPVMARFGAGDLETLDALITAGIAASRAEALSWALERIRARPAYARLGEPGRDIESLKTEF